VTAAQGAVSFIQFFGSALQVTPHFHLLVPDGVFVPREGCVHFEALPPPKFLPCCCLWRHTFLLLPLLGE
jgi:hypothetical protein